MRQYFQIKQKHPDAILLFRVGDFYETFVEDAVEAARILGITLTRRANGSAQHVELAGFPHHALNTYLPRLIEAGKRVAICDQLEDPKLTKKLVKRGITELVTPGVAIGDHILENKENNFLAAITFTKERIGVSFLDISTGEFSAVEGDETLVEKLLAGYKPKEILVERKQRTEYNQRMGAIRSFIFETDDWFFTPSNNRERLLQHFGVKSLKGYGLENHPLAVSAAGAILNYLDLTQHTEIGHISSINRIDEGKFVRLDNFTIHSLELLQPMNSDGLSLCGILDKTITPMGARLLRRWIAFPLKEIALIEERQYIVKHLYNTSELRFSLRNLLREIGDLERTVSKASMKRITPREVVSLANALTAIAEIKKETSSTDTPALQSLGMSLELCETLRERIKYELNPDAPQQVNRGNVIAEGYNEELDELRRLAFSGKDYLLSLQQRESDQTGIPSLKVGFNNVFGYYIEVRNAHKEKVPQEWIRKQTLVNAERYITEELKEYEQKILGAEERILTLETLLFNQLVEDLQESVVVLQQNARTVATLDVLLSFAEVALTQNYVCPQVNDSLILDIKDGRHPVIEERLPFGEPYIANDIFLDNNSCQIMIITGPNMSGKSALLRQTALITLMAQIGSFVPAREASIGIVDSIFTRVGASDNISMGESTFMVEMQEAASILNNLSPRSLVLFDELGRGTSTFDGISIAWAIVEHLHNSPLVHPKTLFATHYHELNEMAESLARVRNYSVSAKEVEGQMIFLRKLVEGGNEHSFGIQVAKLAGMPRSIVDRAGEILKSLEAERIQEGVVETEITDIPGIKKSSQHSDRKEEGMQLSFFQMEDPILLEIRDDLLAIDINNLTPIEALNRLDHIKSLLKKY
ncbi:DNA mismatch repair protein MutS [Porphyromonas circumdentaria]|uniref:DNA mismatch repair protein MutS n=2 Tax=Porphyromonas circumdentaria TaxID=29524 RepID=A0A1T4MTQ7_9PORP|nr:DNA mismatch repair protein MutS [Porphyromonas circumdentaria]MBB6275931.1 DNA mismatch repair protein MutS [Porphyromonas circumdentaria]SJZ70449.1 DNA mismatch repair protein MutS [Porphyromonas circumdentaria]